MLKMKHIALLYLLSSCLHGQNVVTDWAKIVQPAVNMPPRAPAYQMVQRAVIQIAVYDAVMAIEGGYKPFIGSISSSPEQADVRVAAATAAWRTARSRVDPSQFTYLDTQYKAYLAGTPVYEDRAARLRCGRTSGRCHPGAPSRRRIQ